MARNTADRSRNDLARMLGVASTIEHRGVPIEARLAALVHLRESDKDLAADIDRMMLETIDGQQQTIDSLGEALSAVNKEQEKLRQLIEGLTAPPYFPAVVLAATSTHGIPGALVQTEHECRVVQLGDGVSLDQLIPGDEVLISHERNALIAKTENHCFVTGDVATYSRRTDDGRLVLQSRGEEFVVMPAGALRSVEPKAGDGIRFNRSAGMAFEKIAPSEGKEYFLEMTPRDTFAEIGGLDSQIEMIKQVLTLHIFHKEAVAKYKLPRRKAVLFVGPPGNGKTKMARATCNFLASLSPTGRSHFINVKPGSLNDPFYGVTEHKYREIFRIARERTAQDPDSPVVMFFDEVDAEGGVRGASFHPIDDRMANCFMAELDGLEERGNIVIFAATNRLDNLDPALVRPGRLGDLVLYIPLPNRRAGSAIIDIYLPPDIPYAANGEGQAAARQALRDAAVAQLYAENAENVVAKLTLGDGKQWLVRVPNLLNAAHIAKIPMVAIERACVRAVNGGPPGVSITDMNAGIAEFLLTAPRVLTPQNARNYLLDLPQDNPVVSVELVDRRVKREYRYRLEAA